MRRGSKKKHHLHCKRIAFQRTRRRGNKNKQTYDGVYQIKKRRQALQIKLIGEKNEENTTGINVELGQATGGQRKR